MPTPDPILVASPSSSYLSPPVLGGEGVSCSLTCPSSCGVSPDGPRLEESDCPRNWTWQEGSQETLKCEARGNPPPKVVCRRKGGNGSSLPIRKQILVKRQISGTYMCQATGFQGEVTREVVVNVTCECVGVQGWAREGQ